MVSNLDLLHKLSLLKSKAMRQRVWYKALSLHERILVSLLVKYIKQVRNKQLAIVLARLVVKLSIAVNIRIRAEQLGFARAYTWLKDRMSYVTSMDMGMSINMDIHIPRIDKAIIEWFTMLELNFLYAKRWYW